MSNPEQRGNIVVLSPEPWGKMLISKMHYANELVKKGYKVFFVNPPRQLNGKGLAVVNEEREGGRLVIVDTNVVAGSLFFRHKLPMVYSMINRRYVAALKKIVGGPIEELWCFNPNVYTDLRAFGAKKAVLLLYDLYMGSHVFRAARSADAIISVSQVILDYYKETQAPKLLVQHGLGEAFSEKARRRLDAGDLAPVQGATVKIGYTGNLLRAGMNVDIAREIISSHPDVAFHFWGPSSLHDNNVNAADMQIPEDLAGFIKFLQAQPNVTLHGVVGQDELSKGLVEMDGFLFLYSPKTEVNKASNAHKLLEYISTGKVVISTHVSNYANTDLMVMCDKNEEEGLPRLFAEVVKDLPQYNSPERQKQRIRFALDNSYARQADRMQQFIKGGHSK